MFAEMTFDLGLSDGVLYVLRIVATVGAALLGWLLFDPLTRLIYRILVRAATPGWLLPWAKLTGAATLGTLVYMFIPLGGGGGGLGWGPGIGGSPGKGAGEGEVKVSIPATHKDDKTITNQNKKTADNHPPTRDTVKIEILGGKRFQDDGKNRYYLLQSADRAISLGELKQYFEQNRSKIKVEIVLTDDSAVFTSEEDPTRRLQKVANENDIFTHTTMPREP